jgi:predicted alpha/beta superfamily hydrolase
MLVSSRHLGEDRRVQTYLPATYGSETRRYPVLYLHDGQNMFSSAGKDVAFGWGGWELDLTVGSLCRSGKMQEIIMVAVDNSPSRVEEYSGPTQAHEAGAKAFAKYEAFLTLELKPRIDSELRTRPEAPHTAVMGSSLGGLCSLALAWDHPEIFGGAASLSGAFLPNRPNFLDDVLRKSKVYRNRFRVYLDSGARAYVEDDGRSRTKQIEIELRRLGWTKEELKFYVDRRTLTLRELQQSGLRRDKWGEARVSQHNEFYWRLRAWRALTFLFPSSAI